MLCGCRFKKIPQGEEVLKVRSNFFRTSWGGYGGGSEIYCRRCAVLLQNEKRDIGEYLWLFLLFLSCSPLLSEFAL